MVGISWAFFIIKVIANIDNLFSQWRIMHVKNVKKIMSWVWALFGFIFIVLTDVLLIHYSSKQPCPIILSVCLITGCNLNKPHLSALSNQTLSEEQH